MNNNETENVYGFNFEWNKINNERMILMLNHGTKIKEAHKERIQNGTKMNYIKYENIK